MSHVTSFISTLEKPVQLSLLPAADAVHDPRWVPETTNSAEACTYHVFFLYVQSYDKA